MPNVYALKTTNGAIRLERHHDPGPEGLLRPPTGGGGTRKGLPGPSTRGRRSLTWSAKSRRTMRFEFGALPWEMLGRRPVMITLTYPGEWQVWVENARELHKHREAFKERWRRRWGTPIGVWVTEFQRRGAPHLHLYMALPDAVGEEEYGGLQTRTIKRKRLEHQVGSYEARRQMRAPAGEFATWLRSAWWEVVGSELRAHHGRGTDIATAFFSDQAEAQANRARVADYFWRESGKWAQKQPPEGFGGLRFYGRWGHKEGFKPVVTEAEVDEQTGLEIRRVLRKLKDNKMREVARRTGRTYRRGSGDPRGRDGLTVFNIDGRKYGPALLDWAAGLAAEKALANRDADRHIRISHGGRQWLRAWPEFEIDLEGPPDVTDDDGPDEPEDEMILLHRAVEEHLDRIESAEAEMEAASVAWRYEKERQDKRQQRRAELRNSQRGGSIRRGSP